MYSIYFKPVIAMENHVMGIESRVLVSDFFIIVQQESCKSRCLGVLGSAGAELKLDCVSSDDHVMTRTQII